MSTSESPFSPEELAELRWAQRHLEHPSFAARLSNAIGTPIETGLQLLPRSWFERLRSGTEAAIRQTLDLAIATMEPVPAGLAHDRLHQVLVTVNGALAGFFGPLTLLLELPLTTAVMLRSIADIAHAHGEDLTTPEGRIACLEVFALGGRTREDDAADTGYYGLRLTLAFHFSSALLSTGTSNPVAIPAGIELVRAVAARFGRVVSDHAAARMIPIAGALSGALLNLVFLRHFQDMARGHFRVRRLERRHGPEVVRAAYDQIGREEAEAAREFSPLEGW
jgi:hypothetical protein